MLSELCIVSIATGTVESVLKTEKHIEAPNWNSNDNSLLVNGAGKLFRVPLNAPALIEVDTGFAQNINNDHGISPDGRSIVISDSTELGESCIYTLPIQGGTPTKVTDKTPSYWHGWSPDGTTLAYAARRQDTFQIYTCPVAGGKESCITNGFDHCDGPDYCSDGQWIWFNGEQAGSVQLWKIRPDGSQLQQITNDERVNWFPHPSPDGQAICYLAYEAGVTGHPANKNVQLRMLRSDSNEPKVLLEVYGGQGTINVPSWSASSQKFAFVRYKPQ